VCSDMTGVSEWTGLDEVDDSFSGCDRSDGWSEGGCLLFPYLCELESVS
jgi:hypothetical protein